VYPEQETIIDNDGVSQGETVNIRVGASIRNNDMIAVSFGLNETHQVYYKENQWRVHKIKCTKSEWHVCVCQRPSWRNQFFL